MEYDSGIDSIETLQQKALEIGYTILIGEATEAQKAFKEIEEKRMDSGLIPKMG